MSAFGRLVQMPSGKLAQTGSGELLQFTGCPPCESAESNAVLDTHLEFSPGEPLVTRTVNLTDNIDDDNFPSLPDRPISGGGRKWAIEGFRVKLADTGTGTSIDFDLLINGESALDEPINLHNARPDDQFVDGILSVTEINPGDQVAVEMTVTSAIGASFPTVELELGGCPLWCIHSELSSGWKIGRCITLISDFCNDDLSQCDLSGYRLGDVLGSGWGVRRYAMLAQVGRRQSGTFDAVPGLTSVFTNGTVWSRPFADACIRQSLHGAVEQAVNCDCSDERYQIRVPLGSVQVNEGERAKLLVALEKAQSQIIFDFHFTQSTLYVIGHLVMLLFAARIRPLTDPPPDRWWELPANQLQIGPEKPVVGEFRGIHFKGKAAIPGGLDAWMASGVPASSLVISNMLGCGDVDAVFFPGTHSDEEFGIEDAPVVGGGGSITLFAPPAPDVEVLAESKCDNAGGAAANCADGSQIDDDDADDDGDTHWLVRSCRTGEVRASPIIVMPPDAVRGTAIRYKCFRGTLHRRVASVPAPGSGVIVAPPDQVYGLGCNSTWDQYHRFEPCHSGGDAVWIRAFDIDRNPNVIDQPADSPLIEVSDDEPPECFKCDVNADTVTLPPGPVVGGFRRLARSCDHAPCAVLPCDNPAKVGMCCFDQDNAYIHLTAALDISPNPGTPSCQCGSGGSPCLASFMLAVDDDIPFSHVDGGGIHFIKSLGTNACGTEVWVDVTYQGGDRWNVNFRPADGECTTNPFAVFDIGAVGTGDCCGVIIDGVTGVGWCTSGGNTLTLDGAITVQNNGCCCSGSCTDSGDCIQADVDCETGECA